MNVVDKICFAIATVGYIGLVPIAPGTVASLVTAIILWWVPVGYPAIWAAITIFLFIVGVVVAGAVERAVDICDPGFIVIDEVFGMAVVLWLAPKSVLVYVVAFILFRLFDINKPFPVRAVERMLPGGWGVMTDDLVAAVMAWVCVQVFVWLV